MSNLKFEKLGELETKFENIFDGLSGSKIELFYAKTGNEKSHGTDPLKGLS
jgi:hypothetical protein